MDGVVRRSARSAALILTEGEWKLVADALERGSGAMVLDDDLEAVQRLLAKLRAVCPKEWNL